MLFLTLFTILLFSICVRVVWPSVRTLWERDGESGRRPTTQAASVAVGSSRPESLEGVLVAQLATQEITRGQYLREMERIAARDDERHPLTVPPETGSDAGH